MEEIKQAGNYIYQYRGKNEVAVAKLGVYSKLATQMAVNAKLFGKAEPTDSFCELEFGTSSRIAPIFKNIEEKDLIMFLTK